MDDRITTQDFWSGAWVAAAFGVLLVLPLVMVFRSQDFERSSLAVGLASALFWGIFGTVALNSFWDLYYQYIFPGWVRTLAPLTALTYAMIGLVLWWLAVRLPGHSVLWFVVLGGLESIAEHLFGIYALRIFEKVPIMQGASPLAALVFAFFEYIVYWALVAWLALGIYKLASLWKGG